MKNGQGQAEAVGVGMGRICPALPPHPESVSVSKNLFNSQKNGDGGEEGLYSSCFLSHGDSLVSLSGEAARCDTWDVAALGCRMVPGCNVALSLYRPMCSTVVLSGEMDHGRGWLHQLVSFHS